MKILNGQSVVWKVPSAQYLICCDCGLYHLTIVEAAPRSRVRLRFYRDDAKTQQKRRERRHRRGLGGSRA